MWLLVNQVVSPGIGTAGSVEARFSGEQATKKRCIAVVLDTVLIISAAQYGGGTQRKPRDLRWRDTLRQSCPRQDSVSGSGTDRLWRTHRRTVTSEAKSLWPSLTRGLLGSLPRKILARWLRAQVLR